MSDKKDLNRLQRIFEMEDIPEETSILRPKRPAQDFSKVRNIVNPPPFPGEVTKPIEFDPNLPTGGAKELDFGDPYYFEHIPVEDKPTTKPHEVQFKYEGEEPFKGELYDAPNSAEGDIIAEQTMKRAQGDYSPHNLGPKTKYAHYTTHPDDMPREINMSRSLRPSMGSIVKGTMIPMFLDSPPAGATEDVIDPETGKVIEYGSKETTDRINDYIFGKIKELVSRRKKPEAEDDNSETRMP